MIKGILNNINYIITTLGMTPDYFYYVLSLILLPIISYIINKISSAYSSIGNYLFDLKREVKGDTLAIKVVYWEVFVIILEVTPIYVLNFVLRILLNYTVANAITFIVLLIISICETKMLNKRKFVRKEFIDDEERNLLSLFLYGFNLLFYFILSQNKFSWIMSYVFLIVLVIYELFVLYYTSRKHYVIYEHESVKIYLKTGAVLDCKDVSKIKRKTKFFTYEFEQKQFRVLYEEISYTEYYGEKMIIDKSKKIKWVKRIMNFIKKFFDRVSILIYLGESCQLLKELKKAFYKEKKFNKALYDECKRICHDEKELDNLKNAKAILEEQNAFAQCNSNNNSCLLTIISILVSMVAVGVTILISQLTNDIGLTNKIIILDKAYYIFIILAFLLFLTFILLLISLFTTYDKRMRTYFYSIICDEIEERKEFYRKI